MNILVLGSGGREHALAWKIRQSPKCTNVYLHPGNAGTRRAGFNPLDTSDLSLDMVVKSARDFNIQLVVIGPEVLLAEGYADFLRKEGFLVVGPNKDGTCLESSKQFAKEFMVSAGIPTAECQIATDAESILSKCQSWPCVLKLDGLAAGKGVVIAQNPNDVEKFAKRIWQSKEFGPGPHRVLVERYLSGKEISYIGMCDGSTFVPLASATDYKRLLDRNLGPNTGGMGAISPSPFLTEEVEIKINHRIIRPILEKMKRINLDYRGALYVGLMLTPSGDPYVLEFNARFGDPETQAILLRLKSDLVPLLEATARGELNHVVSPIWNPDPAVYVVGVTQGYPDTHVKGEVIRGVDPHSTLFFSAVSEKGGELLTSGGRVLGIGATGKDFEEAREKVYQKMNTITWRGKHFRTDIGEKGESSCQK